MHEIVWVTRPTHLTEKQGDALPRGSQHRRTRPQSWQSSVGAGPAGVSCALCQTSGFNRPHQRSPAMECRFGNYRYLFLPSAWKAKVYLFFLLLLGTFYFVPLHSEFYTFSILPFPTLKFTCFLAWTLSIFEGLKFWQQPDFLVRNFEKSRYFDF